MNKKLIIAVLLSAVSLVIMTALNGKNYLLLSFIILGITLGTYFINFEKSRVNSREIVFIAIVCALAVAARLVFSALPAGKPELFVLILGAMVAGPDAGFLMGAILMLASNMYLGQGAWTPWQMVAYGLVGLISGLMKNRDLSRIVLTIWGFASAFLVGWLMDVYFILGFVKPLSWSGVIGGFVGSFYFDVTHALVTAVLIFLFGKRWIKIFNNYRKKYELFD